MPTPDEEVTRGGIAAAWAGGARGRRVTDRLLLPLLPRLLSPKGEAFLVAVHENDPPGVGMRAAAWIRHFCRMLVGVDFRPRFVTG